MKTALLCTLVALFQVESLVAVAVSSCPVIPGLPGRDGMPGPQGPPGTCACSEISNIAASNSDLNSLTKSLQNLTDGIIEALLEIKQEVALLNTKESLYITKDTLVYLCDNVFSDLNVYKSIRNC